MAFVLTAAGVFGVTAGLTALAFSLLVLTLGGNRFQTRALAGLMLGEGFACFFPTGVIYLTDDPAVVIAAQLTGDVAVVLFPLASLLFASTLPTPLVRPFASKVGRAAIGIVAMAGVATVLLAPEWFVVGVRSVEYAPYDAHSGPGFYIAFYAASVLSVYVLVATLSAARRARGSANAPKMRWWAIAFGTREAVFLVLVALSVPDTIPWLGAYSPGMLVFAYLPLVLYAILKTQLFDIDLRVKWTIRRGTLVGVVAVAFVVVAEIAQNYLSDVYGYAVGGLAAGALLLAFRPLDRLSARVADAAMPRVQETPAYVAFRKMEVYKAALEGAMQDGEVTSREREVLRRLRDSLGIGEADAVAMERDLAIAG